MTPISSILKCAVLDEAGFFFVKVRHSTASSKQTQDVCFGFVLVSPLKIQKLKPVLMPQEMSMQTFIFMCTAQFELTFLDGHLLQELVPSRSGYLGNFDHILKP